MKLAIREDMVPGDSLVEQIDWVERVGFDGIELHGPSLDYAPAELRAIFAGTPVRVSAIEGSPHLLDADPSARATAKAIIRERLELAAALGAVGVLVVPQFGRRAALPDLSPYKTGADLERELLIAQLRELAPAAAAARRPIFLEPLNRYEAYIVNRLEQGAAIAGEVGPEVAIMADFFHMNIEEADIVASLNAAGSQTIYVHVADSHRRQPGTGHLDFRPGFRALKALGYDGWLGLECRINGPYDDAVRTTAAFLRAEWADA